jgi:hypothetical protein
MEQDEQINVNALANDNLALGPRRVFDGRQVFGTSTVSPYNQRWESPCATSTRRRAASPWPAFTTDDPDMQPGTVAA